MKRLLVITVIMCLVGCGGIVLKRQLDQVEVAMTQDQVREILGEPHDTQVEDVADGDPLTVWEYKKVGIHVSMDEDVPMPKEKRAARYHIYFVNDKVNKVSKTVQGVEE